MKKITCLLFLALGPSAFAYPGQTFTSPAEAAIDALSSIYVVSNAEGVEYGGYIFQDGSGY